MSSLRREKFATTLVASPLGFAEKIEAVVQKIQESRGEKVEHLVCGHGGRRDSDHQPFWLCHPRSHPPGTQPAGSLNPHLWLNEGSGFLGAGAKSRV